MLSLGMKDQAVKMLLESTAATDPSEPTFYEYNLRACLVATCRAPGKTYGGKFLPLFISISLGSELLSMEVTFKLEINFKNYLKYHII